MDRSIDALDVTASRRELVCNLRKMLKCTCMISVRQAVVLIYMAVRISSPAELSVPRVGGGDCPRIRHKGQEMFLAAQHDHAIDLATRSSRNCHHRSLLFHR
jgi:hypothetical protein